MSATIWLDITGIRPGSDAAVFAAFLGEALRLRGDLPVRLCRRAPGMHALDWSELDATLGRRPARALRGAAKAWLRRLARRLPDRQRAAIGRFARLQKAALYAWRRAAALQLQAWRSLPPADKARPVAGDVLLMLQPAGDAARFAVAGVRLVFLAADATALTRPDWMSAEDAAAAAIWLRATLPAVCGVIACSAATAKVMQDAGSLPAPVVIEAAACLGARRPATAPTCFVLAAGDLGETGRTRQLLLAWRSLMDRPPPGGVPVLVLAGGVGALVGDVLEQLRNSRLLEGHVRLLPNPTPDQLRGLLDTCLFCIAPADAAAGWGRATLDSLAAGCPCLSAFPAAGATPVDATSATGLAQAVRAWLARPPPRPRPPARGWADVAGELVSMLAR